MSSRPDPLEEAVARALTSAGLAFTRENPPSQPLDFHLSDLDLFIEVKQFHSDRIAKQLAGQPNVLVLQGPSTVAWFTDLLQRLTNAERTLHHIYTTPISELPLCSSADVDPAKLTATLKKPLGN